MNEKPEFPPPDWRCNSPDHNADDFGDGSSCSNPECFKHEPIDPRWHAYEKWFHKLAEEMFKKP